MKVFGSNKLVQNGMKRWVQTSKSFSNKLTIDLPKWTSIDLDVSKLPTQTQTTGEELLSYYKDLTTMRRMEFECDSLYKAKEIRGFCHLYIGQEAVSVGMEAALTREDPIITGYREHCATLARGDTPYRIIAEMMSRATGSTKGKGGSMHYYNRKNNFYGGHGIVGAQVSLGTGLAFTLKYTNKPNAAFAMFGDGAVPQGQVYESSNIAALWKLPVVYVIENNHFGMGTPEARSNFYHPLHAKFRGIPGLNAQGNDVFSVREASRFSKNFAIQNGPLFLEFDTYRYVGHSMSDPGISYRTKDEVNAYKESKDAIDKIKNYILGFKVATENDLKSIDREIKDRLAQDLEKIKNDPYPEAKELFTEVYVEDAEAPFIRAPEYSNSVFREHKQ